ncbi:HAD family phosphatase [Deinococcus metallilatus]|uniref:HAD family phosphatase n=1 Tax=Deinococcus metallilatus TaxID=1211322 RepID=A0AAJ5F664_9DEIO|nr:HAD family phosphatase [Deinococcus metallilatus]RXJ09575.1 HAD family phosphatase [Deinococcus metallilatus]TLK29095.1 HAD family phosphatase [Deinococcus metallilatus]
MPPVKPRPPADLPLLLAFDLDGTLIPDQGREVSAKTAEALARLRALGVRLAIITGRDTPPSAVRDAVCPDAVATNNGGRIEIGGELHAEARFTPAELQAVLAHELEDARVAVFTADGLYVNLPPGREPEAWMRARGYRPLAEAPTEGILKVGFYHPGVADFAARLRVSHPHLVLTGAQPPYTEFLTVTPVGAHKGAALTLIAEALEIPLDRTVAFGDSDNDQAMLELAGYAVQLGTLPLLAPHADEQVASPGALGAYLHRLADRLEEAGRGG